MDYQGFSNISQSDAAITLRVQKNKLFVQWGDESEVEYDLMNEPELIFTHDLPGSKFIYSKQEGCLRNEHGQVSHDFQIYLPNWSLGGLALVIQYRNIR